MTPLVSLLIAPSLHLWTRRRYLNTYGTWGWPCSGGTAVAPKLRAHQLVRFLGAVSFGTYRGLSVGKCIEAQSPGCPTSRSPGCPTSLGFERVSLMGFLRTATGSSQVPGGSVMPGFRNHGHYGRAGDG